MTQNLTVVVMLVMLSCAWAFTAHLRTLSISARITAMRRYNSEFARGDDEAISKQPPVDTNAVSKEVASSASPEKEREVSQMMRDKLRRELQSQGAGNK